MTGSTKRPSRFSAFALATILTLGGWVAWDNWGRFLHTQTISSAGAPADAQTLAQGNYLARIGGCVACHTTQGGDPLAGGRRIDTPFGAVYSSNLTPSKAQGLGEWTIDDFEMALRWGRSRNGRLLLPVFPYNHTSALSVSDVQALFSWLQTIQAVEQAPPPHRLAWPLGTQPAIAIWRSLYFKPSPFEANPQASKEWNRGAYLVQSAGHCAACHGQRNALGSFPAVDDLSGGFLSSQMWVAPSLIDASQSMLAHSTLQDVSQLLRTGYASTAGVSGPMAEFVQQTSQFLTPTDGLAIATYLKSKAHTPAVQPKSTHLASATPDAQAIYKTHCASCHGDHGQGKANTYPALASNPAVVLAEPENLIQMTLYGGYGPSTEGRPRPYGMPPFLFTLNNQQIAEVLNLVRSQWGNQASAVSPMQVDRVRAASYP